MKQRLVILLALLLILVVGIFMVRDFYFQKDEQAENPYEYDLSEYKTIDETEYCYTLSGTWDASMKKPKGLAVDSKDRVYVTGSGWVNILDRSGRQVQQFEMDGEANCLAVDENGDIFLGMGDHIEVRDFSGNLLASWDKPAEKGTSRPGDRDLSFPVLTLIS